MRKKIKPKSRESEAEYKQVIAQQTAGEKMPEEIGYIEIQPPSTGVLQMQINPLRQIENNLDILREQVGGMERTLNLSPIEEHAQTRLRIRELRKQIREYEQEYWQVIAKEAKTVEIAEPEAEIIVAEIVEEVGQMEVQRQYPDEVLQLLQEIRDRLNQPGSTAAVKLKGVISYIPPFVGISYEAELDTENFLVRVFPTFQKFAKELAKKVVDHPDTATSLNNLAVLYESTRRYREAEELYERSLSIGEQQLGANHPDTATSLNNLAALYYAMGRYEEAEPLYVRSLSIMEQQLGADHPDTATSLNNLAGLYESMGRYEEAEPLYVRSLSIREQQLGADHPDTATSLNNLALLYKSMGRYQSAEPLYVRSLSIREQQLGADHPDTATSLNNLAALYESMGRYAEAEPLYVRS
ncbi:tetratricopeptide repeat protein, partial [Microcoleus sp. SVA1_A4]